jgi:O-antigen ligase
LSVSIGEARGRRRWFYLLATAAAAAAMLLSQSRVAALTTFAIGGGLIVWNVWRGRISPRVFLFGVIIAAAGMVVFGGPITERATRHFGTEHFDREVESRLELNQVALDIFRDSPIIGVGLNNFVQVLHRYDTYGMIMGGFPVHNLYLLVLADTGIVGFLGMCATFFALAAAAARLARISDRPLAAVGVGALGMYGLYAVEELSNFTLRHESSLLGFWILAGLVVAALRIAHVENASAHRVGVSR